MLIDDQYYMFLNIIYWIIIEYHFNVECQCLIKIISFVWFDQILLYLVKGEKEICEHSIITETVFANYKWHRMWSDVCVCVSITKCKVQIITQNRCSLSCSLLLIRFDAMFTQSPCFCSISWFAISLVHSHSFFSLSIILHYNLFFVYVEKGKNISSMNVYIRNHILESSSSPLHIWVCSLLIMIKPNRSTLAAALSTGHY